MTNSPGLNAPTPDMQPRTEIREMLGVVRRVCAEQVSARAAEIDEQDVFPSDIYTLFNELDLVGWLVPPDLGGVGASVVEMSLLYEEIGQASATCSLILSNSIEALAPITAFAHLRLRDEVLYRVLEEGEIPCFSLTEPGAGSDATGLQTRARPTVEGGWTLSGEKAFCTNGSVGNLFLVFAVTDPEERKGKRLSAFIVDRNDSGFSTGRDERTLGTRGAPLTPLTLDGVCVGSDRMVGERGQGLAVAMHMLNESRVGAAAQCVGLSSDALQRATKYASEREQGGHAISEYQAVQLMLADMVVRTEAARALTLRAAEAHDRGSSDRVMLGAAAKTLASDSAMTTASDAIQVHGGYGICEEFGVSRILRDAKAYQVFDGTNQIQRLTVAKSLLGRLVVDSRSAQRTT